MKATQTRSIASCDNPPAMAVKDCHACHGKAVVRVRFVDNKHGKVRTIVCPDCNGRGSWLALPYRRLLEAKGNLRSSGFDREVTL